MHGRVKVKTDAQKAAEKKEKRKDHLAKFTQARDKLDELITQLQDKPEQVENEILLLTGHLCSVQSDWTKFWRYRQTVFNQILDRELKNIKKTKAEVEIESEPETESEFEKKMSDELYMTYQILIQNAKSYIAWSHRRFCLQSLKKFNEKIGNKYIEKDIKLTETMLTAMTEAQVEDQGRNFHCWDHRRLLLQMANNKEQKTEIGLTAKLLKTSISNFSAWHYRSNLLKDKLDNETIKKELDLIMNAIFVDPNDQSIWIYYKWIISSILHVTQSLRDILEEHEEALSELLDESDCTDVKLIRSILLAKIEIYKKIKNKNNSIVNCASRLAQIDSNRKGYYQHIINQHS